MSSRLRIELSSNVTADHVVCWGITVALLKKSLFGKTPEERTEVIKRKVTEAIEELGLDEISDEFRISLISAWVRYYVFKIEAGDKSFVLNILSPNSPIESFCTILDPLKSLFRNYKENIAVPVAYTDEFMLQEWYDGLPLSELKEGDIMKNDAESIEIIEESIYLTARLLYRLWRDGYVYTPWEDYEVMYKDGRLILLDVTRFEKVSDDCFFQFYYGAPFCPPDVLKDPQNPVNRMYFRGTCERDYFGVDKRRYIELFTRGIAEECESEEEFRKAVGSFLTDSKK
ncbi:hypothetical protein [Archaeoglobus neptunius]|uniref:hypothetical protein n=1 Tax=Archaeoglobus neptunius TaxID=2798580 RepID=UPI001925BB28|nr:hypothetical protein [Archaeoglobus neptunius]